MADKANPDVGPDTSERDFDEVQSAAGDVEAEANGVSAGNGSANSDSAAEQINWKAQVAYLSAEIENMKKRFFREASDIRKYANEDLLRRVAPALDNLTLALKAASKAKGSDEASALFANKIFLSFIQGVEMTAKQFEQTLESAGVEFIKTVGEPFDPTVHEAIGQSKKPDVDENIITEEFERGFKLFGRVVRPAKVFVNKH